MKKVLIATANAKSTPEARTKPHVWPIKTNGSSSNIPISLITCQPRRPRAKVSIAAPFAGRLKKPMAVI